MSHPQTPKRPAHLLQRIQHALHPHAPRILPSQHIRPQIALFDPHQRTPPPQPLFQRLRSNDEQIPQLREDLHARGKGVVERPGTQQLRVLGQVLGDHEAAGGVDLEFLEVVEEQGAEAEGQFGQEGGEVGAVEDQGREVVGAG